MFDEGLLLFFCWLAGDVSSEAQIDATVEKEQKSDINYCLIQFRSIDCAMSTDVTFLRSKHRQLGFAGILKRAWEYGELGFRLSSQLFFPALVLHR